MDDFFKNLVIDKDKIDNPSKFGKWQDFDNKRIKEELISLYKEKSEFFYKGENYAYIKLPFKTTKKISKYAYFEPDKDGKNWFLSDIKSEPEILQLNKKCLAEAKKNKINETDIVSSENKDNNTKKSAEKYTELEKDVNEVLDKHFFNTEDVKSDTVKSDTVKSDIIDDSKKKKAEIEENVEDANIYKDTESEDCMPEIESVYSYGKNINDEIDSEESVSEDFIEENNFDLNMISVPGTDSIKSFKIGKFTVVQELYKIITEENPSFFKDCDEAKRPVENITWEDAILFCNKLSEKQKLTPVYYEEDSVWKINENANGYRLPTSEEWLFAAKGGDNNSKYSFAGSNNEHKVAWFQGNNSEKTTHDVGLKHENKLGLYDMSGNVWEWCWDTVNGEHICRGGAYDSNDEELDLNSIRNIKNVEQFRKNKTIGFRLVRTIEGE